MLFVLKRLSFIFMVVWAASTITFFIPRISDVNPIRERFAELARLGGFAPGDLEKIVEAYNKAFGLDKSLWVQYYDYMSGILRLDFGVSLNKFPKTVLMLIAESLPWTIGLLLVTTIFSFVSRLTKAKPQILHWFTCATFLLNLLKNQQVDFI